jgi:hypothetical protein
VCVCVSGNGRALAKLSEDFEGYMSADKGSQNTVCSLLGADSRTGILAKIGQASLEF